MGAAVSSSQVDSSRISLLCNFQNKTQAYDTNWTLAAPISVYSGQQFSFSNLSTSIQLPVLYPTIAMEVGNYDGTANISFSFLPEYAESPDWLNFTYYNAPVHIRPGSFASIQIPPAGSPPLNIGSVTAGIRSSDVRLRLVAADLSLNLIYGGLQRQLCGAAEGSPQYILSSVAVV